jgi:UDP-N-acetylenolpyruvoylglucosamine reductase
LQHRSPHTRAGHGGNDCPGRCEISAIRANLMLNTGNAVAAQ